MGIKYIDTHSHLYADEFSNEIRAVTERVLSANVKKVILPNIDSGSFDKMIKLSSEYPNIYEPMIGLHPCSVKAETYKSELDFVIQEAGQRSYIGVGEIGMDLYWDKTTKVIQEEALRVQCQLAIDKDIPVALHTRNATKEVIKIIQDINSSKLTGIFHCFGDGIEEANSIIELGFKLGIGGVVTFKNSGLDKVLNQVDLEHLVLETDSPYLAPAPFRGKRNESSYIPIIAQKLADVKQVKIEEVAEITSRNATELFSI